MKNQKTDLLFRLDLFLILLPLLSYLFFLCFFSAQVIPAFLMQFIFLLSAINFQDSIPSLIFSSSFLLNTAAGFLNIYLIFRFAKALIIFVSTILLTRRFVRSLNILHQYSDHNIYSSTTHLAFTAGFLRPQVYLSHSLLAAYSPPEIKAILSHELFHRLHLHPLKTLLINLLNDSLPFKSFLVNSYLTLIEAASDKFAEAVINDKRPIVSALLKFYQQSPSLPLSLNYFNSQNRRIEILLGKKRPDYFLPLATLFLLFFIFLLVTYAVNSSRIFFECNHLLICFRDLFNSIHISASHCL